MAAHLIPRIGIQSRVLAVVVAVEVVGVRLLKGVVVAAVVVVVHPLKEVAAAVEVVEVRLLYGSAGVGEELGGVAGAESLV
jgi:hypothetical protein